MLSRSVMAVVSIFVVAWGCAMPGSILILLLLPELNRFPSPVRWVCSIALMLSSIIPAIMGGFWAARRSQGPDR